MPSLTQDEVLDRFRRSGALLEGHFRLSSGLHSTTYLQSALVLQHPAQAEALGRALAARMQRAWVDFAYGREPGSSDAIAWPRYRADARQALEFNSARSGLIDDYRREYCAFWNRYAIL